MLYFFFSSRRRHTRCLSDWSSDVCSSDLIDDPNATEQFERDDGRANEAEPKDAHADHHTPSAFLDSSRSSAQRRLVSAPKAGSATSALSRSRGQPVATTSINRPGRADITATRSD